MMVKKEGLKDFEKSVKKKLSSDKSRPKKKHSRHKYISKTRKINHPHKHPNTDNKIQVSNLDNLKKHIEEEHKKGIISTESATNLLKATHAIREKIVAGKNDSNLHEMIDNLKRQWRHAHETHNQRPVHKTTHLQTHHSHQSHDSKSPTHAVHHKPQALEHKSPEHKMPEHQVHHEPHKENHEHKTHKIAKHKSHEHHNNHHKRHIVSLSNKAITYQAPKDGKFQTDKDVAMDFATKIHRKFDHLIKATVLFGSQATGEAKPGSDIDLIIVIDDAAVNWDLELTSWYREELAKLIASQNYGKDLHINTIRLTTWWRDLIHGDPVVLNIVRNGQVLIDIGGFFNPIKALMIQGKIHSTPEAVYAALQRSPQHLTRSKMSMLGAVEGVYWCMVDAAQAALITLGKLPPSPEHVTKMLHESFVETGVMKSDFVKWYREIYILHKQIAHGEIRHVKATEIEAWQQKAEEFMKKMVELIDKLIESRKNASKKL